MKQIKISNIPIELERKHIKNMYLRILPPDGQVHISAPLRMSEEEITRFVNTKLDWIIMQQDKIRQNHIHRELQYLTGDEIHIWGKAYQLIVHEKGTRGKIYADSDRIIMEIIEGSSHKQREDLLEKWYRKVLEQEILSFIDKWEKIINVKSSTFIIRDMKTRWGTCNIRSRKICLNLRLVHKPMKCLEYVVVHELVHLLEKSHNHVFKAYMDQFLPNWRNIKKELNNAKQDDI